MLAWLAGVACQLQRGEPPPAWGPWLEAGLVLTLACVALRLRGVVCTLALCLAGGLAGLAAADAQAALRLRQVLPLALEGRDVVLTGVVATLPQGGPQGLRFTLAVDEAGRAVLRDAAGPAAQGEPPRMLALGWYAARAAKGQDPVAPPAVRAGERWRLTLRLGRPHGLINPHGFDRELNLFEQGVRATGTVRRGERLQAAAGHPVQRWRQWVRDGIEAAVPDAHAAGVLSALAVGDQGAIEPGDWTLFRLTGVAHLMSISGLHVTMFAWLAAAVIGWTWRRSVQAMQWWPAPLAARWGGLGAATAYAVFAGWGVPAQRTVGMLAVVAWLSASGRRWPWPWVLLAAAVVVTAWDPWALLQPGFWLSFMAVALLMTSASPPGDEASDVVFEGAAATPVVRRAVAAAGRVLREGLRTQWVATGGLAPLSLVFFQQVSVVGLLANLVAIPLVTLLVTPLALLGVAWPGCWRLGAWLVQQLGLGLAHLAAWPGAVWAVPVVPGWAQGAGLLAAGLWMARLPLALRLLALPLALPLVWPGAGPAGQPPPGQFEVLAADVGQGTAVLLRTQGHLLVFDAGPVYSSESDAGQRVLLPLLQALGHARIDRLVLSHRDTDHVGGAPALLQALPVGELWSSVEDTHPVRVQAEQLGVPARRCEAGQSWRWDGVRFEVLHPHAAAYASPARPNALSCVLRVAGASAQASILLTGDIEKAQEAALVATQGEALASTVLLVPHHGSRTSSTPGFVALVRPAVAVVQAGHRNRFGHPAPVVLQRYAALGIPVHDSAACGAWRWRSDEPTAAASCERQRRRRYWHWRPAGADRG